MINTITIPQELTFGEFYRSTLYYFVSGRRFKIYLLFIFGISLLSLFLGIATTRGKFDLIEIVSSLAPFVIMFLLLLIFMFAICLFLYLSKPWLFKSVSYEFTHWGIFKIGERTKLSKPWRDISKFKESASFFLLYINGLDCLVIQKRMFKDAAALNDFRDILKEHVSY